MIKESIEKNETPGQAPHIQFLTEGYSDEQLAAAWSRVESLVREINNSDTFVLLREDCLPYTIPLPHRINLEDIAGDIERIILAFHHLPIERMASLLPPTLFENRDPEYKIRHHLVSTLIDVGASHQPGFMNWVRSYGADFAAKLEKNIEEKTGAEINYNPSYFAEYVNGQFGPLSDFLSVHEDREQLFSKTMAAVALQRAFSNQGENLHLAKSFHPLEIYMLMILPGQADLGNDRGPKLSALRDYLNQDDDRYQAFLRDLGRIFDRKPELVRPAELPALVPGDFEDPLRLGHFFLERLASDPLLITLDTPEQSERAINGFNSENLDPRSSIYVAWARRYNLRNLKFGAVLKGKAEKKQLKNIVPSFKSFLAQTELLPKTMLWSYLFALYDKLSSPLRSQFLRETLPSLLEEDPLLLSHPDLIQKYCKEPIFRSDFLSLLRKNSQCLHYYINEARTTSNPPTAAFATKILADLIGPLYARDTKDSFPLFTAQKNDQLRSIMKLLFSDEQDLQSQVLANNFLLLYYFLFVNNHTELKHSFRISTEEDAGNHATNVNAQARKDGAGYPQHGDPTDHPNKIVIREGVNEQIVEQFLTRILEEVLLQKPVLAKHVFEPLHENGVAVWNGLEAWLGKLPILKKLPGEVMGVILTSLVRSKKAGRAMWDELKQAKYPQDYDPESAQTYISQFNLFQFKKGSGLAVIPLECADVLPKGYHAHIMVPEGGKIDWARTPVLIYHSILAEGRVIVEEWELGEQKQPVEVEWQDGGFLSGNKLSEPTNTEPPVEVLVLGWKLRTFLISHYLRTKTVLAPPLPDEQLEHPLTTPTGEENHTPEAYPSEPEDPAPDSEPPSSDSPLRKNGKAPKDVLVTVDIRTKDQRQIEENEQLRINEAIRQNQPLIAELLNGRLPESRFSEVYLYRRMAGLETGKYIYQRLKPEEIRQLFLDGELLGPEVFVLEKAPYFVPQGYRLRTRTTLDGQKEFFTMKKRRRSDNARMAYQYYQESGLPPLDDRDIYRGVMRITGTAELQTGELICAQYGDQELTGEATVRDLNAEIMHRLADEDYLELWIESQTRILKQEIEEILHTNLPAGKQQEALEEIRKSLEDLTELKVKMLENSRLLPGVRRTRLHTTVDIQIGLGWIDTETSFNQGTYISMEEFLERNAAQIPMLQDFMEPLSQAEQAGETTNGEKNDADEPSSPPIPQDHIREIISVEQFINYQNFRDLFTHPEKRPRSFLSTPSGLPTHAKTRLATREHRETLVALFRQLKPCVDTCLVGAQSFDLLTISGDQGFLWEVKSINTSEPNEHARLRGALGQLLEYEFYGIEARPEIKSRLQTITKAILLSKKPLALRNGEAAGFRAYLEYLERAYGIYTYWLEGDELRGLPTAEARLRDFMEKTAENSLVINAQS